MAFLTKLSAKLREYRLITVLVSLTSLSVHSQDILSQNNSISTTQETDYDVVLVGAGIAGSYTAHRIKEAYPDKKVAVLEMSNRVGGRLFSYKLPGTNTFAELGGMRIAQHQRLAYGLAKDKLGLTLQDTESKQQRTYFDGIICKDSTCSKDYNDLLTKIKSNFLCENIDKREPAKIISCLETQQYAGKPLTQYTIKDFLSVAITPAELKILHQGFGYSSYLFEDNVSAVFLLSRLYLEYGELYSVESGMQDIPRKLIDIFKSHQGDLRLNTRVDSIDWHQQDNHFKVKVFDGVQKTTRLISTKNIIWTAGQASINKIASNFINKSDIKDQINKVTVSKASKIWFSYSDFWWHNLNIRRGYSTTDLPILSSYYFDPLRPQTDKDTHALIKASYNYGPKTDYWQTTYMDDYSVIYRYGSKLYRSKTFDDIVLIQDIPSLMPSDGNSYDGMVADVTDQLSKVHDMAIPSPVSFVMVNWSNPPFNGAFSGWHPVQSIAETAKRVAHVDPNVPFYIVGDTWSLYPGWIQGALETSEYVLNRYFQIPAPAWLNTNVE